MRAVWMTGFGGPEVLVAGDAPDPVPGPGQVLVETAFIAVHFVETMFRASGFGPHRGEPPLVPGNGVAGVVSRLGEGVDPALAGQRVVTATGGSGAYAQRVAVDAAAVYRVPDGLELDAAVALLGDGRTATGLIRTTRVTEGDRVLVEAAAGGVGSLLVQLAKAAGAKVVAVAGGPEKVARARELGADIAVDHQEPDWAAKAGEVDVVFDGVGGQLGETAFTLLRHGGRMALFGRSSGRPAEIAPDEADARRVRLIRSIGSVEDMRGYTEYALTEAAAGRLVPVIGQRFPLERAADAHRAIESASTFGRTILVA